MIRPIRLIRPISPSRHAPDRRFPSCELAAKILYWVIVY